MSRAVSVVSAILLVGCLTALGGCVDLQSALAPAGAEARRIAVLWWVLFAGGMAILLGVAVIALVALFGPPAWRTRVSAHGFVVGGGIVFPIAVLSVLLAYSLLVTGIEPRAHTVEGEADIAVVGERWWWRVIYLGPDGRRFESANEVRVPVGQPIEIALTSADVIHSFWVPKLAGKLDMIPGRTNTLHLTVDEPGISRGQCAEYCGGAHAMMSFYVVALPATEYDAWLAREAGDARQPETPVERRGERLFLRSGCGACHTIRGTEASGSIGPDLTHVGGRLSIGAATLSSDEADFARWIEHSQDIKPDNLMPPFGIFSQSELRALATYLSSLR